MLCRIQKPIFTAAIQMVCKCAFAHTSAPPRCVPKSPLIMNFYGTSRARKNRQGVTAGELFVTVTVPLKLVRFVDNEDQLTRFVLPFTT